LRLNDTETVVLWQRTGGRLVVFAAGPRFVAREWIAPLAVDQATSGARILLRSEAGEWNEAPPVGAITRTATESSLPWTIAVSTDDEAKTIQEFSTRRLLLAAGLSLLVVVVIAGGAFTLRAVSRELAVAQLQSDFVSAVSHEFRTPLTSLRQFTDLLSDAQEPSEEKRRVFHEAQGRATDRLQRLVESLLDFGRMEAGARPYQLRRMRAADFAQRVVADFRRDAAPQGFQIECSTAALAERCDIAADGNALTTALWNLLDNAVKYSGTGRTVSVEVSCTEGNVAIAVRDAGVGITRTERSRIFDKFVRGSASRDGEIEGTGIGLAMVRHIVSAHGGRVTVESEPGNGSTFTIGLPVVSSPALAQESDDLQVRSSGVEARS
jgi:signal transduction histidine kinase